MSVRAAGVGNDVVRDFNRSLVLNLVRDAGTTSRAALVRQTTLTAPTVSAIVDDLVREELVQELEVGELRPGRGRPPRLIEFNARARFVAGVHVGVHSTQIALADAGGDEVAWITRPTPHGDAGTQLGVIAGALCDALHIAEVAPSRLHAVGVCVPGFADEDRGVCLEAPNLGWYDVPVGAMLSHRLDAPVHLSNDAQAALVAEQSEGAAAGCRHAVLLYAGTGISAPAMLDGRISPGHTGAVGQVGHCPVPGSDLRCNCGRTGCLETVASGPAIARAYVEAMRAGGSVRELSRVVASDVARAATRGDATARRVLEEAGAHLGTAAATVVNLFDPEIVVFGGGLSAAGDALTGPLERAMRAGTTRPVRFAVSMLGDRAETRGALLLALDHVGLGAFRRAG